MGAADGEDSREEGNAQQITGAVHTRRAQISFRVPSYNKYAGKQMNAMSNKKFAS